MKQAFNTWLAAIGLGVLSACASQPAPVVLSAVGPEPREKAPPRHEGYLQVYSAFELFRFTGRNIDRHSNYTITDEGSSTPRQIKNYIDRFEEDPAKVALPPGTYRVSARAAKQGRVIVPVVIREGETTVLYLDGLTQPHAAAARTAAVVKLPNGRIAGWATEDSKRSAASK